jgi:hypothetical protein
LSTEATGCCVNLLNAGYKRGRGLSDKMPFSHNWELKTAADVTPAKAGVQKSSEKLDARLRGNDTESDKRVLGTPWRWRLEISRTIHIFPGAYSMQWRSRRRSNGGSTWMST